MKINKIFCLLITLAVTMPLAYVAAAQKAIPKNVVNVTFDDVKRLYETVRAAEQALAEAVPEILAELTPTALLNLHETDDTECEKALFVAILFGKDRFATKLIENGFGVDTWYAVPDSAAADKEANDAEQQVEREFAKTYVEASQETSAITSLMLSLKYNPNPRTSSIPLLLVSKSKDALTPADWEKYVNTITGGKETYLMFALARYYKNAQLIESLFNAATDEVLKQINDKGQTTLMLLVKNRQIALIRSVLDRDADINAVDKEGLTALMYACTFFGSPVENFTEERTSTKLLQQGSIEDAFVGMLLEKNPDINKRSKQGETALSLAAKYGLVGVVKQLLDRGAAATAAAGYAKASKALYQQDLTKQNKRIMEQRYDAILELFKEKIEQRKKIYTAQRDVAREVRSDTTKPELEIIQKHLKVMKKPQAAKAKKKK
jgi:hypothetical protein